MSGKLDGALGYLSGPMEFVADHGVEWRRKFIQMIKKKLKINTIFNQLVFINQV